MKKAFFFISFFCFHTISHASTTPSDVYHQASLVHAQVIALKKQQAPAFQSRVPGIQVGKTPLHAYGKSLELMEKILRYQEQHNLAQLKLPELPSQQVRPADVLGLLLQAQRQLDIVLADSHLNVDTVAVKRDLIARTPSDVYEKIWQISYVMDALVEPIKPADVMRNAQMIEEALVAIADRQGRKIDLPKASLISDKTPQDVNLQFYKLLYKIAKLERSLQLKPLIVPSFPAGKIKPEDTYDTTGNILADLTRISIKLNIPAIKRKNIPRGKVTPSDVYAQIVRLNAGAQQLID